MICCEMARLSSHLLGVGVFAMDVGAMSAFLYTFTEREKIYDLSEQLTGARFTTSFTRVGGQNARHERCLHPGLKKFLGRSIPVIDELDALLSKNRIFIDRTQGLGVISKEDAIAYGLSGPNLRASGVDHDLRKAHPYLGYEQVRIRYSDRHHGRLLRSLPRPHGRNAPERAHSEAGAGQPSGGPINVDSKNVLPRKEGVLMKMEELIHHFIVATQGIDAPVGEVYFGAENPKGELGFYICSKGGGVPYRLKIRAPSFVNLSILPSCCPAPW